MFAANCWASGSLAWREGIDAGKAGHMSNLALTIALADYDHTRDLASGRVPVEGIDLRCLIMPVEEIFYRALSDGEFDGSELSMAKYVSLRAQGDDRFVAIPVFPSRVFRHSSLYVRRDGPVRTVDDLAGRRVGVPEWSQTAAVYSRGFLAHQFGLDLRSVHWVQAGVNQPGRAEKVSLELPNGIELARVKDKSLNNMLLSGELDAVLSARPPAAFAGGDPRVARFFENFRDVEIAYYRQTRVFPIMHAVVLRREVLEANRWVARNLFEAFQELRRRTFERVFDNAVSVVPIPWWFEYAREGRELLGDDYFPYGIEKNRITLETFLRYAHEQGVCRRLLDVEELFPSAFASSYKV